MTSSARISSLRYFEMSACKTKVQLDKFVVQPTFRPNFIEYL